MILFCPGVVNRMEPPPGSVPVLGLAFARGAHPRVEAPRLVHNAYIILLHLDAFLANIILLQPTMCKNNV